MKRDRPVVHWCAHYMPDVLAIVAIIGLFLFYLPQVVA